MRNATKKTAAWLGASAGIAGMEHGYFEILQGKSLTHGLVINSIGPPCVPKEMWNACEPALTVVPDFLITGILAVVIGLFVLVWSVFFIQRKSGGFVLVLLSVALLLFGGGFFPPLIGLVGGFAGTKINKPFNGQPGSSTTFFTKLWPWPLVIFLVWIFGQWIVGYFVNEFLQSIMVYGVILILVTLVLSVITAYARDFMDAAGDN
jgi:hypothetical protein